MTSEVEQLTFGKQNHFLSPYGAFSPDDQWLVYDTRNGETEMGSNDKIEKVNVQTGRIEMVYRTPDQNAYGPGCGTPSYHPHENKVIFIHGIENASEQRPYDLHRRTCVMVDEKEPGKAIHLDARDVTLPFTPGALRGGTHAHQFSGDGKWIGFTYNDALLAEMERATGRPVNLRTVGVMTGSAAVEVDEDPAHENNDGRWYAALVARVVVEPEPGTDEIGRAFSNAWVGRAGYLRADGGRQRAQAYLGRLKTTSGGEIVEVFVSDIPDRIDIAGPQGPLEGTESDFPMPPEGVVQRRVTYTEGRKYPGVATEPRHWVLSSSDGKYIAFLARDEEGIVQIYAVSPLGSEPVQMTFHETSIQNTFFWKPDSHVLCYVCDNSVFVGGLENNLPMKPVRLTQQFESHPIHPCWSKDGKMIAFNVDTIENAKTFRHIFLIRR